ncbi:MAG: valine--tRNA ligase [Candidatus Moraniibacteriota bacterium]
MNGSEIPKTYTAKDWEDRLYRAWEESGFFNPNNTDSKERYCNILPPPNANGELHLGHASGYTVMDIFGRYQRMNGKKVLLLPGKDHAGIQTQVVFEKKLQAEKNLSRFDLGREKFYEEAYAFCTDRANYMRSQEKKIGLATDWSREKFTLDPEVSKRATETFVKMYADGMIYRGERIINWCPRCATALSDVEVEYETKKGKLYWIKYGPFTLATARPETKLGDTAVAVHPDDDRYRDFVGKKITIPGVLGNFEVTVVADEAVDRTFGSGVIKVTPAHDFADFDIAKRHNIPVKQVIGTDGRMMDNCGKYAGMTTRECREAIVADMEKMGLIEKIEDYEHSLSVCERCKTTIEPLISKQWFINVDAETYSLKKKSIEALRSGTVAFHPENMKDQMIRWLENLHDWCISLQIWWGHRIPVFYCQSNKKQENIKYQISNIKKGNGCSEPIVSIEKIEKCPYCGGEVEQDPDTLDTWFSSGQWPYTTLGYPENDDAKTFYPTDMMVMGRDIFFFWAARMVMLGLYRTKVAPFKHLYFTGLIRDKEGKKMSKSRGNGINPLEMIGKYGADALRMSLVLGSTPGNDTRLYDEKVETFRNFTNKLWNIGRYVNNAGIRNQESGIMEMPEPRSPADHWILSRLQEVSQEATRLLENYQPSLAGEKLRDFTWSGFADWYVEIHKIEKNDGVLRSVFETLLKLWHPFMPFVTEALWQTLHENPEKLLMTERWPDDISLASRTDATQKFQLIIGLIQEIRALKALYHIDPVTKLNCTVRGESERSIQDNEAIFKRLARVDEIHFSETLPPHTSLAQSGSLQVFVELEGVIDFDAERERIGQEKTDKTKYIATLETKLGNQNFIERAKQDVVESERAKLEEAQKQLADLEQHLASLL